MLYIIFSGKKDLPTMYEHHTRLRAPQAQKKSKEKKSIEAIQIFQKNSREYALQLLTISGSWEPTSL